MVATVQGAREGISNDDEAPDKSIKLDFGKRGEYNVYVLDNEHDGELTGTVEGLEFNIKTKLAY